MIIQILLVYCIILCFSCLWLCWIVTLCSISCSLFSLFVLCNSCGSDHRRPSSGAQHTCHCNVFIQLFEFIDVIFFKSRARFELRNLISVLMSPIGIECSFNFSKFFHFYTVYLIQPWCSQYSAHFLNLLLAFCSFCQNCLYYLL